MTHSIRISHPHSPRSTALFNPLFFLFSSLHDPPLSLRAATPQSEAMFAVNRYQPERARQPAASRVKQTQTAYTATSDLNDDRSGSQRADKIDEKKENSDLQQQEEHDDTITVISQRKARKLLKRQQSRADVEHDEEVEDDEQQKNERREAKRAKRAARRQPDEQQATEETEEHKEQDSEAQPIQQQKQPVSLVDLRALLALKNSTKAREVKPKAGEHTPTAVVIKQTQAGAVIAPADEANKGQKKKDPAVRTAERAARKRARELKERRERGEVVDDHEEAQAEPHADTNTPSQPTSADTTNQPTPGEQSRLPLTAEEELVREQKRLAARPSWMMRGIHIDPSSSCPTHSIPLHPALLATLQRHGITDFFPVQSTVVPVLLWPSVSDVAVSSPTGSGKTLVYLLPILHRLTEYRVRRLRALVLVPSRDLAMQVAAEAREYGKGVGVKVGVSVGGGGWKREQAELVRRKDSRWSELIDYSTLTPLTSPDAYLFPASTADPATPTADEYDSLVDILVTTPGRLVDHLNSTAGFTLSHLQWLVIDEVDRLLTQNYNDWAKRIHTALTPTTPTSALLYSDPAARCQKLLFSATLTGDPSSLAALHLQRPVLFIDSQSRQKRYTMPEGLRGSFYLCEAAEKPLLLLYVLSRITLVGEGKGGSVSGVRDRGEQVLIFTSSLESCHRVARLLQVWGYHASAEYSSSLSQHQRTQLLSAFRARHLSILVTSDLMARGLDITGVTTVVNYDPPLHIQTHVHRAGRTARAGQSGSVVTLCKRREYSWFIAVVRRAANSMMDRETADKQWMAAQEEKYDRVMERLRDVVEEEERGRLDRLAKLSKAWTDSSEAESNEQQLNQPEMKAKRKGEKADLSREKNPPTMGNGKQRHTAAVAVETVDGAEDEVDESEWSFQPSTKRR